MMRRRNTRRMNRLEELGRVDAEKAKTMMGKRNLRDEKKRIVRELRKADGGTVKGSEHPLAGREGNVKHKLKSQKQYKAITDTKKYKDASYNEKQKMLDAGGAYTKSAKKDGGRIRKMGGGMSTARRDMMSGYYKNDMGMKGGKMYKDGGKVGKKQQGYKARKDESIAMRIRKPRTAKQLKASRDESYGKFGSKAKKSGKINR